MKNVLLTAGFCFCLAACQSAMEIEDFPDFSVSETDALKELSHAPAGVEYVDANGRTLKIDFSYDEIIGPHITEYGERLADSVHTLGQLIDVYTEQPPYFRYCYSSHIDPYTDGDYVFPKLEYMLAQECFRNDCSSQTRKAILKLAVNKQPLKYGEYFCSHTAKQTGLFLMAVIMVKEQEQSFIISAGNDVDLQKVLCLNSSIRVDDEFRDIVVALAKKLLSND